MKKINQIEPLITEKEVVSITEYLNSGAWLTQFEKTKEFEQRIAEYVGVKYATAVPSGTVALYLSLLSSGIGRGDIVAVPNYTMIATNTGSYSIEFSLLSGAQDSTPYAVQPGNLSSVI